MKSFIAKRLISILVNLRYLRFKLLKYKENNTKICNTFDHNFKNIPLYIMRKVSLERYYFVLNESSNSQRQWDKPTLRPPYRDIRSNSPMTIYSNVFLQQATWRTPLRPESSRQSAVTMVTSSIKLIDTDNLIHDEKMRYVWNSLYCNWWEDETWRSLTLKSRLHIVKCSTALLKTLPDFHVSSADESCHIIRS